MDTYSKERIEVLLTNVYNCKHANLDIDPLCVYFVSLLFLYLSSVTMHRDHILTSDLREAFDYLVNAGETSSAFDVRENVPKGKNRKRASTITMLVDALFHSPSLSIPESERTIISFILEIPNEATLRQ